MKPEGRKLQAELRVGLHLFKVPYHHGKVHAPPTPAYLPEGR